MSKPDKTVLEICNRLKKFITSTNNKAGNAVQGTCDTAKSRFPFLNCLKNTINIELKNLEDSIKLAGIPKELKADRSALIKELKSIKKEYKI